MESGSVMVCKGCLRGRADRRRFLRARKFSIEQAYDQFLAAEKWSKENRLLDLYETIDIQEYEDTRRLVSSRYVVTFSLTRLPSSSDSHADPSTPNGSGRGINVACRFTCSKSPTSARKLSQRTRMRKTSSKSAAAWRVIQTPSNRDARRCADGRGASMEGRSAPAKMLRVFALYESMCRFVTPWCTAMSDRPTPEAPITQGCNIIDISGTGIRQFWDLKSHLQDSSGLATAYYPETLDKIFVRVAVTALLPHRFGRVSLRSCAPTLPL